MKGILVQPGVIDEDYPGDIKIMTPSPAGISVVQSGRRIAQLLLRPHVRTSNASKRNQRGNAGSRSSDASCVQAIGAKRPEITLTIQWKECSRIARYGGCYVSLRC